MEPTKETREPKKGRIPMHVAGLPSKRISQLTFPQLDGTHRHPNILGAKNSGLRDGMSEILMPGLPPKSEQESAPHPNSPIPPTERFAGKTACMINSQMHKPGCRKGAGGANKSKLMTDLFCSPPMASKEPDYEDTQPEYWSPEALSDDFSTDPPSKSFLSDSPYW